MDTISDAATATATSRSLERSIALLRALAAPHRSGFALTQLARSTGLPHPTVHRLLVQLCREGLVMVDEEHKRYSLGPLAFELGLAAADHADIRTRCVQSMDRLSAETEDTCYLVMRSGAEAVCVDRREGTQPIRVLTLDIGSRRPLGVGAAGLAILAALEDDEAHRIIEASRDRLGSFNRLTAQDLTTLVAESRGRGYALSGNWVTLGVTAVGVALRDAHDRPFGALSISAVNHRMEAKRQKQLARLLQVEAVKIEARLFGAGR